MPKLTIGRLGFSYDIENPLSVRTRVDGQRFRVDIEGELRSTTLANTKALKSELEQHVGHTLPITLAADSFIDGFYTLTSVDVDSDDYALNDTGLFGFRLSAERLGTAQAVMFTSLIDGILITNSYGLLKAGVKFTWSPPVGAEAVTDAGTPVGHTRTTTDGAIDTYVGVDVDLDPTWSVDPDKFYKGACFVQMGGQIRTGLDTPKDLLTWKIGNGLVEVFADGTNNGAINLQHAVSKIPYGFQIKFGMTTAIPAWNYPSIEYNSPEMCTIKIIRDANEADPTDDLHNLELTIRRGCPFVYGRFVYTGAAATWSVDREAVDAAVAITPAGASGAMGIEDSANDAGGHRWFLASPDTTTKDTTNGGLDWASTTAFSFILGMEIGGSGAHARDDTGDVILQALGFVPEAVTGDTR